MKGMKQKRMKQMKGLLELSRPSHGKASKGKIVYMRLQPQRMQILYSSQDDREMKELLGRIDLREAKLEQVPDGFLIHQSVHFGGKSTFKLVDTDKETIDTWFVAVYNVIAEFSPTEIDSGEEVGQQLLVTISGSLRDEISDIIYYALSCQLLLPARAFDKPSIKWICWKTDSDLKTMDSDFRAEFDHTFSMKNITFPRERKRDSFYGLRKKSSVKETREAQMTLYIDSLFSNTAMRSDPSVINVWKKFLEFNSFFKFAAEEADNQHSTTNTFEQSNQVKNLRASRIKSVSSVNNYDSNEENIYYSNSGIESFSGNSSLNKAASIMPQSSRGQSQKFGGNDSRRSITSISGRSDDESTSIYSDNGYSMSANFRDSITRSSIDNFLFDAGGEAVYEVIVVEDKAEAKALHKEILRQVSKLVFHDKDRVREFQDQTKDFGRSKLTASEYCAFLVGAIGATNSCVLIPKMAKLLPDHEKRAALLEARDAILRRKRRRNQRRSKQISEGYSSNEQRRHSLELSHNDQKTRPKSDVFNYSNTFVENRLSRTMSLERPASYRNAEEMPWNNWSSGTTNSSVRKARDQESSSKSYQNLFGEDIQRLPIEEERPSLLESSESIGKLSLTKDLVDHDANKNETVEQDPVESIELSNNQPHSPAKNISKFLKRNQWVSGSEHSHSHIPNEVDNNAEDNPVLARLKKQGAVNFMLR